MYELKESDWKLFRKKIVIWQERYMERLNQEYIALLSGEGNASDKFWNLLERMKEDRHDLGVCCEMSRSRMLMNISGLLNEGAITEEHLSDFSEELHERFR